MRPIGKFPTIGTYSTGVPNLSSEASMVLELKVWKEASYGEREELDDSRTSMPTLARPSTSDVQTSKHASHVLALWLHHTILNQSHVAALVAKK